MLSLLFTVFFNWICLATYLKFALLCVENMLRLVQVFCQPFIFWDLHSCQTMSQVKLLLILKGSDHQQKSLIIHEMTSLSKGLHNYIYFTCIKTKVYMQICSFKPFIVFGLKAFRFENELLRKTCNFWTYCSWSIDSAVLTKAYYFAKKVGHLLSKQYRSCEIWGSLFPTQNPALKNRPKHGMCFREYIFSFWQKLQNISLTLTFIK